MRHTQPAGPAGAAQSAAGTGEKPGITGQAQAQFLLLVQTVPCARLQQDTLPEPQHWPPELTADNAKPSGAA